jgi:hypothetical protein
MRGNREALQYTPERVEGVIGLDVDGRDRRTGLGVFGDPHSS